MKKLSTVFVLIVFLTQFTVFAQIQKSTCIRVMNTVEFSRLNNRLQAASTDEVKLTFAKNAIKNSCLTSAQAKQITQTFQSDFHRLDFAMDAFHKTIDAHDFYEVFDSFIYFSNAFRLHDYILSYQKELHSDVKDKKVDEVVKVIKEEVKAPNIQFPKYNYPSVFQYNGERQCERPLSDEVFMDIAQQLVAQNNDFNKLTVASVGALSHCLSVEQLMKLASLLSTDENKLTFLIKAYPSVFDPGNYLSVQQVFTSNITREKLNLFLLNQNKVEEITEEVEVISIQSCEVSAEEFKEITASISEATFENTKMNLAKSILSQKQCFSSSQIKTMVNLMTFDRTKLELAKFAYDYCTDSDNYFKLNSAFGHSSTQNELIEFVNSKQNK